MIQSIRTGFMSCIFLLATISLFAQDRPDIGLIAKWAYLGENLLIVDANAGEIVSFATVGKPIDMVVLDEEKNTFYIRTQNGFFYKGTIDDGEIESNISDEDNDLESEFNALHFEYLVEDLRYIDRFYRVKLKIHETAKKNNLSSVISKLPALSDYEVSTRLHPTVADMWVFTFYQKDQDERVRVVYNAKSDEIILNKKYTRDKRPLMLGYNEAKGTYYFSNTIFENPPKPNSEDYDITKPGMMQQMTEDLMRWADARKEPSNWHVIIYDDKNMANEVIEFQKTNAVIIYDGKYALIERSYGVELYNIETKETVWTVDTDF